MKKFILFTMVVFSLGAIKEDIYGKPGKENGRDKKERPEKETSEKIRSVNQNELANKNTGGSKLNWGQYKKNPTKYDLEEIFGDNPPKTNSEIKASFINEPENQKAIDARKNWGWIKNDLKNTNGTYNLEMLKDFFGEDNIPAEFIIDGETSEITNELDKELKDAIKAEKVVRKELRNEEFSPEILPGETEPAQNVTKDFVFESWINYYLYEYQDDESKPTTVGEEIEGEKIIEQTYAMIRARAKYHDEWAEWPDGIEE